MAVDALERRRRADDVAPRDHVGEDPAVQPGDPYLRALRDGVEVLERRAVRGVVGGQPVGAGPAGVGRMPPLRAVVVGRHPAVDDVLRAGHDRQRDPDARDLHRGFLTTHQRCRRARSLSDGGGGAGHGASCAADEHQDGDQQ